MKSDFEKVLDFNIQFGVLPSQFKGTKETFVECKDVSEKCLALIKEEFEELQEAIKNDDFIETIDALCDLVYVIQGMCARIGVNFDKVFDAVHTNNMSKLCKDENEAKLTVAWYTIYRPDYDSPVYRLAPNGENYVVYNESTKKILKSISWKVMNLEDFL